MSKISFQRQVMAGFAISLMLVFMVTYLSYNSIRNLDDNMGMVNHTHEVLLVNNQVLTGLLDAETNKRAYVATGVTSYLDPYHRAVEDVNNSLSHLKQLVSDKPAQVIRVDSLEIAVRLRQQELEETIALRQQKGMDSALAFVLTGKGKVLMENVKLLISKVETEERKLLKIRQDEADESAANTTRNIIVGAVLIFMIVVLLFFFITRTFRRQREAEKRIQQANDVLEQLSVEDARKNWLLTGSTTLNEQLRGENDIADLSQNIINTMAAYTDAAIGALYILDEETKMLVRTGTYAFDAGDDRNNKPIQPGEGLIGQSAATSRTIVVEKVPEDYARINSGLGRSLPQALLIVPFVLNNKVKGVIELGYTSEVSQRQKELLQLVNENIAIAVQAAQARERTQRLYEQLQQQAEELESQQEELRQTNEELTHQSQLLQASEEELRVQQEELRQTNAELEEKASLLEEKNTAVEEARVAIIQKAQELEQTNKYKSEFLANMSHELRTPLNSILILAKLLSENKYSHLNEEEVKYAGVIYNAGNDLLTLINDILDLSKIESGKLDMHFEPVSIQEVADDMTSMFREMAAGKQIDYTTAIGTDVPEYIQTDKVRLEQVIRNLLSNAFKFTAEKGAIQIGFGCSEDRLRIAVKDNGIGIAPEKQKIIFEAFQQADGSTSRRYGGTGLGLSISRELAALLGGEISLSSTPGVGSIFTLTIPLTMTAEKTDARYEPQLSAPVNLPATADDRRVLRDKDKTILIIEDDVHFSDILKDYAHKKGFKVIVAHAGDTALELAAQYKPDAVLLDIMLPVMDGWTVLRQMRAMPGMEHTPVHIMSATERSQSAIQESGVASFLNKPVSKEALEDIFGNLQYQFNPAHNKVLIIEDQQAQSDDLRRTFTNHGLQADQAFTGREGLQLLNENEYDCVVLDLRLPDMSGTELLAEIKKQEQFAALPVIINTAMEIPPRMQQEIMQYTNAMVIKTPKSNERLLDEVKLFMNRIGMREASHTAYSPSAAAHNATQEKALKDKKVLIVDDDMRNIFALSSSLQYYDMTVEIAGNGVEALKKLEEQGDIDMVLMDIMMPEMDGYEAMRQIRKGGRYAAIPIIALTAKAMKNDREKCLEAGASDYIAKPVDVDKLLSLMRVWLSK